MKRNSSNNKLTLQQTQLVPLVESLILEKRAEYRERKNVELILSAFGGDFNLPKKLASGDFKRVLSNLLNNAFEAIGEEGKIEVYLEKRDKVLIVEVRDNGKGMPEDVLPKLMNRGASFGKTHGTGLGLFHARKMVEEAAGKIEIESKPMHGCIVRLMFCGGTEWS